MSKKKHPAHQNTGVGLGIIEGQGAKFKVRYFEKLEYWLDAHINWLIMTKNQSN